MIKKAFSILSALIIISGIIVIPGNYSGKTGFLDVSASAEESVWCGLHVRGVYIDDNTLKIEGRGDMRNTNYDYGFCPYFWPNTYFNRVIIEDGITFISNCSFSGCSELSSITIPDSVWYIGKGAFYGTDIYNNEENWEDGIRYVGKHLISAEKLTASSYTVKEGTLSISEDAFQGCSNLSEISIPDSVRNIGANAFADTEYFKNESNWDNGALYINNHLIKVKEALSPYLEIRQGTVCIADRAVGNRYYDSNSIPQFTDIYIPDSVTAIGNEAFSGIKSLRSIGPMSGVKYIGYSSFEVCLNLEQIYLPEGLNYIGASAFLNCSGLWEINLPESLESIGHGAFGICIKLKNIIIPENVEYIGTGITFLDCSLETIEVNPQNKYYHSKNYCLIDNDLKYIMAGTRYSIIPVNENISGINERAFDGAVGLDSITIPDGVTFIGDSAFRFCCCLKYIRIPTTVCNIYNYAFNLTNPLLNEYSLDKEEYQREYDEAIALGYDSAFGVPIDTAKIILDNPTPNLTELYYSGNAYIEEGNDILRSITNPDYPCQEHEFTTKVVRGPTKKIIGKKVNICKNCGYKLYDEAIEYSGTAELSDDRVVRGQQLTWSIEVPDNTIWVRLFGTYTDSAGNTVSLTNNYKNTNTAVFIYDDPDTDFENWILNTKFTYTGTSQSALQNWKVQYKTKGSSEWKTVKSSDGETDLVKTVLVGKSYDIINPPTQGYEKFSILNITPDNTTASPGERAPITIVTTDDVSKIRISYTDNNTGKTKSYTYQTTSSSVINHYSENGLSTWVINFKYVSPAKDNTYSVQCRGGKWGEAQTFTTTVE